MYTITVDQFLNLPFPEWYYAEMQDDAPASAWDRYTGKMSTPCIPLHTQWGPRDGQEEEGGGHDLGAGHMTVGCISCLTINQPCCSVNMCESHAACV